VVKYAPQLELLKRAAVVITHAGLNTVLESLAEGVPLVAMPLGNDQPGVAARVAAHGAGVVVSRRGLSAKKLRISIQQVLDDRNYRNAAAALKTAINSVNGLERAADLIENALAHLQTATAQSNTEPAISPQRSDVQVFAENS
jgi:MGT family glycosyltransferase